MLEFQLDVVEDVFFEVFVLIAFGHAVAGFGDDLFGDVNRGGVCCSVHCPTLMTPTHPTLVVVGLFPEISGNLGVIVRESHGGTTK